MIRKDSIYLIVIVGLLIWIVVQTCSPPPEPVEDTTYKDSVKVLKSQKAVISSRMKAIHEASILRQEMDSINLAQSLKEIARLKVKADKAVEAIPVRVLEENPSVGQALTLLHGVIKDQETLIDTLQSQLAFERNVREQLVALHYDEGKINTNMMEMCEIERIRLQDMNERLQRKAKGKGLFFGLGFGAGWLARSGVDRL